jgi:hypothetical protein
VREVWIWRHGKIIPYVLRRGGYKASKRSAVLPDIDLTALSACVDEPTSSAAVKRFRTHCRKTQKR